MREKRENSPRSNEGAEAEVIDTGCFAGKHGGFFLLSFFSFFLRCFVFIYSLFREGFGKARWVFFIYFLVSSDLICLKRREGGLVWLITVEKAVGELWVYSVLSLMLFHWTREGEIIPLPCM